MGWISTRRMRELLTLIGQAREIHAFDERRAHLVAGAHRLVGAAFVATVIDEDFHAGGNGRLAHMAAHGLDGPSSGVLSVLAVEGTARHPALRASMKNDRYEEPLVWNRRRHSPDGEWYRDSYFTDYVQPNHLDDCILGGVRIDATTLLGVGAMRERKDTPFSNEEEALLEAYAFGAMTLWRPRLDPVVAALPPRLRRLHDAMLNGGSEKAIASSLGLSQHSVHTYARQLYRALGVSSRAELMARRRP